MRWRAGCSAHSVIHKSRQCLARASSARLWLRPAEVATGASQPPAARTGVGRGRGAASGWWLDEPVLRRRVLADQACALGDLVHRRPAELADEIAARLLVNGAWHRTLDSLLGAHVELARNRERFACQQWARIALPWHYWLRSRSRSGRPAICCAACGRHVGGRLLGHAVTGSACGRCGRYGRGGQVVTGTA